MGLAAFPPRQICSVDLEVAVIIEFDVKTQGIAKLGVKGVCKLAIPSRFCVKPKTSPKLKKKNNEGSVMFMYQRWMAGGH